MKRLRLAAVLLAACTASGGAETFSAEGTWRLLALDGAPFLAEATISFAEPGRIAGRAPCNTYAAGNVETLPRIRLSGLLATRRSCADIVLESRFFGVLAEMEAARIEGGRLVLSNAEGREMVFEPLP
jgi:heat shock protein HslJ